MWLFYFFLYYCYLIEVINCPFPCVITIAFVRVDRTWSYPPAPHLHIVISSATSKHFNLLTLFTVYSVWRFMSEQSWWFWTRYSSTIKMAPVPRHWWPLLHYQRLLANSEMKSQIGKSPWKDLYIFLYSQSMETSVEIGSIIAVCWNTMMHAGISQNSPLGSTVWASTVIVCAFITVALHITLSLIHYSDEQYYLRGKELKEFIKVDAAKISCRSLWKQAQESTCHHASCKSSADASCWLCRI